MFNSVAYDVVIGLVFVYVLYSLLTTIVGELIVTFVNMRSVMLRQAIERMLNDGYYDEVEVTWQLRVGSWLRWFFLQEHKDFKKSFAGRFYDYPSVRYLSKVDKGKFAVRQSKPSYFTDEYFAEALINILKDKGIGEQPMEKVGFALRYNTLHIQTQTSKIIQNHYDNANGDEARFKANIQKWFNETMDRVNGWYKRKMQGVAFCLGLIIATCFNVDTIKIAHILANDKDARTQLVNMGIAMAKDSARYQEFYRPSDTLHSNVALDSGYARVTKDIVHANEVLGLGWGFDKLTKEDTKGVQINLPITAQIDQFLVPGRFVDSINSRKRLMNGLSSRLFRAAADTNVTTRRAEALGVVKVAKDSLILLAQYNKRDSVLWALAVKDAEQGRKVLDSLTHNHFVSISKIVYGKNLPIDSVYITGQTRLSGAERTSYFRDAVFSGFGWIGFLLTALALSLGAPFWFDLLKKFISLRGTGIKPEEKKKDEAATPVVAANSASIATQNATIVPGKPAPAKVDVVKDELRAKLAGINGIISVNSGYMLSADKRKIAAIEVQVAGADTARQARVRLGAEALYGGFPVDFVVNSVPVSHDLAAGDEIKNTTGANGPGTLGCFVKKQASADIFLMSCWHVLKADGNWWQNTGSRIIVDGSSKPVGIVTEGTIADSFDVGFAQYTIVPAPGGINNPGIKKNWRTVTSDDAMNSTPVQFKGNVTTDGKGYMWNESVDVPIQYNDKIVLTDLFCIVDYDAQNNIVKSAHRGDSGALIMDMNGCPLGILIAGDDKYTYAAKFSNFLAAGKPYSEYSIILQ